MSVNLHVSGGLYPPGTLIGHRYRITRLLGQGGMGAVFLAEDRLDDKLVAVKSVLPAGRGGIVPWAAGSRALLPTQSPGALTQPQPRAESATGREVWRAATFAARPVPMASEPLDATGSANLLGRLALTREFATLASLRHPHIVSVLDYGFADGRPFFTMEFLSAGQELLSAAQASSLQDKVLLLAQIAQALAYLHRRGILHRDLKPANVLVVAAGAERHAKVLDFGLALSRDLSGGTTELAGTLAYMAPELLTGSPPSEVSDLYALGMLAFELLSGGTHPLEHAEKAGPAELIRAILSASVDTAGLAAPESLRALVARLLSREPTLRPSDAAALSREFYQAAGQPPPVEQVSIRESYLQAARFVSRKEEMETLLSALHEAAHRQGSLILIGGESGVGKSRLLEELRTQALVQGALVLRGQAVREGGGAFHVFREVIELLCLNVPLEDPALSVISSLFPRISGLLHRSAPALSELDVRSTQERTLGTLERLFESACTGSQHTTIVLLEDLQWAGIECAALLARMAGWIAGSPLLVIGTYRDDEAPNLPESLPHAKVLKLRRFDRSSISSLSESMLGAAGKSVEITDFLYRESEGNPFFVVEILRSLAQEAGNLDAIASHQLPAHILTGGVRGVLERRINQVPSWARPLLELAAVAGRQIEPELLSQSRVAQEMMQHSVDTWLSYCADLSIVELSDQRWRFAHDKLRECTLEQLRAACRLKQIHAEVAQAIERAYPDTKYNEHALALAHHLIAAIPLVPVDKALDAALKAAERAIQQLGFADAASLLERALAAVAGRDIGDLRRGELLLLLGQAQIRNGNLGRGKQACQQAAELARRIGDPRLLAQAATTHGSEFTPGQRDETLIALLQAARRELAASDQALHARVLARLAAALQPSTDPQEPIAMAREAVALARRLNDPDLLRPVLMSACSAFGNFAEPKERLPLNRELITLATQAQDRVQVQRGHLRLIFDCLEVGDVAQADESIEAYAALGREFRQLQYQWPEYLLRAMRALMKGCFAHAAALATEGQLLGERAGDPNVATVTLHHWSRLRTAEQHAELLAFAPQSRDNVIQFRMPSFVPHAVMAASYARAGQLAAALPLLPALRADKVLRRWKAWMYLLAEPCFLLQQTELAQLLHEGLLPHQAEFFVAGFYGMCVEPPYSQALGLLAMTLGRFESAVHYLEEALARTEAVGLRSCLARLRYYCALAFLGRGAAGDVDRAGGLLTKARELAKELGQVDLLPLLQDKLHALGMAAAIPAPDPG